MQVSGAERLAGHPLGPVSGTSASMGARAALWHQVFLIATLVACDTLAICLAFALAYLLRFRTRLGLFYEPPDSPLRFYSSLVFWLVPLVLAIFASYRLYRPGRLFEGVDEYIRIVSASTMSVMLVALLSFLFDSHLIISRGWILFLWISLMLCVGVVRFIVRRGVYAVRRAGHLGQHVIIAGSGPEAIDLFERIKETPESGLHVICLLDPEQILGGADEPAGEARSGESSGIRRIVAATQAEAIIVSDATVTRAALAGMVRDLTDLPTDLQIVPGMHEILTTGVQVREIRGLPLVTMNKVRITGLDRILKRLLDNAVAALALVLLSPLLLAIAAAVKLTSPGPVLHRRRVIGQRGRRFDALKFRTMYVDGAEILARHPGLAEELARQGKLTVDPRVTPVGRWLRRFSLDELPQLINVVRGQMSLVGPRMITEPELPHFGKWKENLFTVKPGMTGRWQISGRSDLGYDHRVQLDMHYIRTYSIWSDIDILLRTIPAVLSGTGAY